MREVVVVILLAAGTACALLSAVGVVAMHSALRRLHYVGPSVTAAVFYAAAIAVRQGAALITVKAVTLVAFLVVASPALSHVLGRAIRIAEAGDWRAAAEEAAVRSER
jgi:multisubunit Na+/H+ antiporter MnhG subunit